MIKKSLDSNSTRKKSSTKSVALDDNRTTVWGKKGDPKCKCSCMDDEYDVFKPLRQHSGSTKTICSTEALQDGSARMSSITQKPPDDLSLKIEKQLLYGKQDPYERASIQIEIRKLQKLLTETVNFMTITMCIPQMIENDYELLRKSLTTDELDAIKILLDPISFNTCSLFGAGEYEFRRTNFFTESSASSIEKLYSGYKVKEKPSAAASAEVENVWTATNLIYDHTKAHPELCSSELQSQIPEHVREFITAIENLFHHILSEMAKSPKEAEDEEIELSKMFLAFEQLGEEMNRLQSQLHPTIESNLLKILKSSQEVQNLKDQRKKLKDFLVNGHKKIRNNLEKKTMMYNLDAMKTTKEKMGPRREMIAKHQNSVKEDLAEEKSLRVQKFKMEQVLQSIIAKYEVDMEDRNKRLAHLNEMYEMETQQMNRMQERFQAQDKVYVLLMEEKKQYEQMVWEKKLDDIRRQIAARKIQRFYRGYLAFMQSHGRKKGRKGKGKRR